MASDTASATVVDAGGVDAAGEATRGHVVHACSQATTPDAAAS
jgi:hypothetical protein